MHSWAEIFSKFRTGEICHIVILIIIDCGSEAGRDHSILLGTTGDSLLGFLNISINTLTTKTGHLKLSLPEIQTLVHEGLLWQLQVLNHPLVKAVRTVDRCFNFKLSKVPWWILLRRRRLHQVSISKLGTLQTGLRISVLIDSVRWGALGRVDTATSRCHLHPLEVDTKTETKNSRIPEHPYGISKCIVLGKRSAETNCSYGSARP